MSQESQALETGLNRISSVQIYYNIRPFLPRRCQIYLRRGRVRRLRRHEEDSWPIWPAAGTAPPNWTGWPAGKRFALVLTHDVESEQGCERCEKLAAIEADLGLRSTFAFIPHRSGSFESVRHVLRQGGFEIMVHGLKHDGKLYKNSATFHARAKLINHYLHEWGTRGFCSPASHHHLIWQTALDIDFDISTFDTDPFEPQSCGLGRIFPFWVRNPHQSKAGYVELPYTLPQDFTLFILMKEPSEQIWRKKVDWIAEKGGMALIKTHPDYMQFNGDRSRIDLYPASIYQSFLKYILDRYGDEVWFAQPSEVAQFWRGLRLSVADYQTQINPRHLFCPNCLEAMESEALLNYKPADEAESDSTGSSQSRTSKVDPAK